MPVEAKPLFRPDALRPHLKSFQVPDSVEAKRHLVQKWAELLSSAQGDSFTEQELLPDFITDIFCGLLGYLRPADSPARYTRAREKYIQVDGKFADAVLGEFVEGQPDKPIVALEGKGPKDPLDRPFAGRKRAAVEQGYGYAINLPCDWIVVTSMRQTRLYHKGSDQQTYERFDIAEVAASEAVFRKFVFLLAAERVVPVKGRCHFYDLKDSSEKVGRDLTKGFYVNYADIRQDVFDTLCEQNDGESRHELLAATQKLLDRVLFTAFCEDRGLLPADTLKQAFEHTDPYNPKPIWSNFRGLFHSIDAGNPDLNIPPYNGGLFADDPFLESLDIPDETCAYFRDLGEYEYRPASEVAADADTDEPAGLIDVEILGHIFEQSITDLEQIRNELDGLVAPVGKEKHKTRRKKEGAFYTPAFITRYIVEQTLGGVVADRFEQLRQSHAADAAGTAVKSLADPSVYDLDALNKPQREALVRFWEAWQDELATIRVLDPACGSGAFLIEAFDQLHAAYQASNERLEELRGHRTLFDLDRRILQNNLFGVDINEEAIQICRLSLWIKTAERGKTLTSLDDTIRVGNSVVDDPSFDPKAFDWQKEFSDVFDAGGFDVVVANPPYIRQEWIKEYKPHWEKAFASYHGAADIYVYFFERGLQVLRPGGCLSFIVTNKWMKANYGHPLREHLSKHGWVESVVDFGHAKQIFKQVDVFPAIVVIRRPDSRSQPTTAHVCSIPRERLRIDDLSRQICAEGFDIDSELLGGDAWRLEPPRVYCLLDKIRDNAIPLAESTGIRPYRGILTGFNDAFLIDTDTKNKLVTTSSTSGEIIKPYVRGQDIKRWNPDWARLWMIAVKSSSDHQWPWTDAEDDAESIFAATYPAVHRHLKPHEDALRRRQDKGRNWWELRSCAYWGEFENPKFMYQDITWQSKFCLDSLGTLCNNTVYFLPTGDPWILAVLNSPIAWWFAWRTAVHGKDEALRFFTVFLEQFPIPNGSDVQKEKCQVIVRQLTEVTRYRQQTNRDVLDWLRVEHDIDKPSKKLKSLTDLDSDAFVAEIKRLRGKKKPSTAAALRSLRDEHACTIEPVRTRAAEVVNLERRISDLVNEAYSLTPNEIDLMWKTAPPRMPTPKPS